MKTKIKTIALIAMLSVLQVNAQETRMFLPIFSDTETTTRCYVIAPYLHPLYYSLKIVKAPNLERTYKIVNCYYLSIGSLFDSFTVSEDNSKLWGNSIWLSGDTIPVLIMDLNLNIGDTFEDILWSGTQWDRGPFTVVDIYKIDGRKHIEFDLTFGFNTGSHHPLIFIEGVGPTFYPSTSTANGFFRAKYIGDSLEYCVRSLLPYSSFHIDCDCSAVPPIISVEDVTVDSTIRLYPQPVDTELSLQIPEGIDIQDVQIRIYDTSGNLHLHTNFAKSGRKLNVGHLMPGIFLLRIIGSNINETVKFIKS